MNPQTLIRRFYAALATLDAHAMQACYARDARFEDPVFALQGREQIGAMWHMLCQAVRAKGQAVWRVEVRDIDADADRGCAHWEARYRVSASGRRVHNIVEADFTFVDGLIATHRDHFDFWRWSRQALGPAGLAMGWSNWLRNHVRGQAEAKVRNYLAHQTDASR